MSSLFQALKPPGQAWFTLVAPRILLEYKILTEVLQITSVNNISQAHLKFVFQRRIEYHIANTITQTFLLVIVGYLSLFFEITNFTDRTMVVLTTMLVIATIMSAIQQVSRMAILNFLILEYIYLLGSTQNILLQIDWLVAPNGTQCTGHHYSLSYLLI